MLMCFVKESDNHYSKLPFLSHQPLYSEAYQLSRNKNMCTLLDLEIIWPQVGNLPLSGPQDHFGCGTENISSASAEDVTSSAKAVAVERIVSAPARD